MRSRPGFDVPVGQASTLDGCASDSVALMKPQLMTVVLFTAFAGLLAAPEEALGFAVLLIVTSVAFMALAVNPIAVRVLTRERVCGMLTPINALGG